MRITAGGLVALLAAAAAAGVRPVRYEVEGLSMAPGLLPGDIVTTGWFPRLDPSRPPRRFERWVLAAPGASLGIKRVVGLPGETVSIREGDLVIDGRLVLSPPAVLAEIGTRLPGWESASATGVTGVGWPHVMEPRVVFDDAPFAAGERRRLLPVRDAGIAAVLRVAASARGAAPVRAIVRVGARELSWRIPAAGRFALAAGRLDGHAVGAVWPLAVDGGPTAAPRSCLPPGPPARWDVALPWSGFSAENGGSTEEDDRTPPVALRIDAGRPGDGPAAANAELEAVAAWRDNHLRPAADGVVEWRVGADECFVLGDFPSGSRDSRHWGSLSRKALHHRVVPADR